MTVESAATQLDQQQDPRAFLGGNTPYARTGPVGAYPYSKLKQESTYPYSGIGFQEEAKTERSYAGLATGETTPFSAVLQGPLKDMSGQDRSDLGQGADPPMGFPRSYRTTKGGRSGMPGSRSQGPGRPYPAPSQRNLPPAPPARSSQGGRSVGPRSYNSDVMPYEETFPSRRPGDAKASYGPNDRNQVTSPGQAGEPRQKDRLLRYMEPVQDQDYGSMSYASEEGATDGSLALDSSYQTQEGSGLTPTKTRRPNPAHSPQFNPDKEMLDGVGDDYQSFYPGAKNEGEEDNQVAPPSAGPRSSRPARPMAPGPIQGSVAFSDGVASERTSLVQQNRQRISKHVNESIAQIPKSGGDEFTLQAQVKYEELKKGLATVTQFLEKPPSSKGIFSSGQKEVDSNILLNQVRSLSGLVDDIYDMAGMIIKNEQSLRTENQMALDAYTNSVIDTLAEITAEKTGLALTDQLIQESNAACQTVLQSTMGLTNGLAAESKNLVNRYKALDTSMSALDASLKRCAQDMNQFLVSLQALQHRLATYESSAQATLETMSQQDRMS